MMFSREPFIYRFLRNIIIPILLGIILVTPIYSQYKFSYRLGLGLGFTKPTKFNESLSEQELSSIGSMWFPINYDFSVNVYPSIRLGYKKLSTSLITYNRSSENYIQNTTSYRINESSSLLFSTRRNKKIDLTEFYDLVYQYRNDCLTASINYNKEFYSDSDIEPTQQLFFSLTIIPLGTYESKNLLTNPFK